MSRVYFDITKDGEPMGKIVFKLYDGASLPSLLHAGPYSESSIEFRHRSQNYGEFPELRRSLPYVFSCASCICNDRPDPVLYDLQVLNFGHPSRFYIHVCCNDV